MKITKTYSIDDDIYKSFDKVTNRLNVNKSSIIEEKIKDYLKDNGISDYKTYFLISNPEYEVTIESQDTNFLFLSDGSKMLKTVFDQTYKKVERMNPSDPSSSIIKLPPVILKFLMPNIDRWNLLSKLSDSLSLNDKLDGKLFVDDNDKLFRVVEEKKNWLRIRVNENKNVYDDISIKREIFLKSYRPYKFSDIDIGGFGFEYLDKSRIDDNLIFKLGGGIFMQFFNSDIEKLKEFIMNNNNITIMSTGVPKKLYINIDDIEIAKMLEDDNVLNSNSEMEMNGDYVVKLKHYESKTWEKDKWVKEKDEVIGAMIESMKSDIKAIKLVVNPEDDSLSQVFSYELSVKERLDRITNSSEPDKKSFQINFIKDILDDLRMGIFQKEFKTSRKIKDFMKSMEQIKTFNPDEELSKLKYELLLKIVKYHNEIYN